MEETPHEAPVGNNAPERPRRIGRMPSFLQDYMEKRRVSLVGESAEDDSEISSVDKREKKGGKWGDNFSKFFSGTVPKPERISAPSDEERPKFWDSLISGSETQELSSDVNPPESTVEATPRFDTLLPDSETTIASSPTETTRVEYTSFEQQESALPAVETTEPPERIEEPINMVTEIPSIESLEEIFTRQHEEDQAAITEAARRVKEPSPPERWLPASRTIFERRVITKKVERAAKPEHSKKAAPQPPKALSPEELQRPVRREVVEVKETVIIERVDTKRTEQLKPSKQELAKQTKLNERRTLEKTSTNEPLSVERIDRIVKKRLEEQNLRAVETVLEKTIEAAKNNDAIESLYEKRHETRGDFNNAQAVNRTSMTTVGLFTQQSSVPTNTPDSVSPITPPPKGQNSPLPKIYKQAAVGGFWLALLLILIFAFAVILIR